MSNATPPSGPDVCRHCGDGELRHQEEHPGLCCDCEDLSLGMPLSAINAERAAKGKPPAPPWQRREPVD
jgi:hypothetical protein